LETVPWISKRPASTAFERWESSGDTARRRNSYVLLQIVCSKALWNWRVFAEAVEPTGAVSLSGGLLAIAIVVDRPRHAGMVEQRRPKMLVSVDPWCSPMAAREWRRRADARNATAA
jgi:hypothetical protein